MPAFGMEAPRAGGAHWLLWVTGAVAAALGTVAMLLWATRSSAYLFDLMLAFCG